MDPELCRWVGDFFSVRCPVSCFGCGIVVEPSGLHVGFADVGREINFAMSSSFFS